MPNTLASSGSAAVFGAFPPPELELGSSHVQQPEQFEVRIIRAEQYDQTQTKSRRPTLITEPSRLGLAGKRSWHVVVFEAKLAPASNAPNGLGDPAV